MAERKVLNKYYAHDFDPSKIPKVKRKPKKGSDQKKVRMMMPMSVRCTSCGNYIYKGTKFNSRKEVVKGESYLGIPILRFYSRCSRCSAEFTIKTDPKNGDYVTEHGATSNYDELRNQKRLIEEEQKKKEMEEEENAMKRLENKSYDSKKEMEMQEVLDNIQIKKSLKEMLDPNDLLTITLDNARNLKRKRDDDVNNINEDGLTEEDMDELKEAELLFKKRDQLSKNTSVGANTLNGKDLPKKVNSVHPISKPASVLPFKIKKTS